MLEELRILLNINAPSIPMDEHEQFMFKQQFGPAVGRIGNYVIFTQADAQRIVENSNRYEDLCH